MIEPAMFTSVCTVPPHNDTVRAHRPVCLCDMPLLRACSQGSCERVKEALSNADLDVNEKGSFGMTALHLAVRAATPCTPYVVQLLLNCGVDVNAVDDSGFAAMHHNAVWAPNDEHGLVVARLLLRYGARADRPIRDGFSADLIAEHNRLPRLAAFLSESTTRDHFHAMRQRIKTAARALAKVRLVCDAADRGPLFGKLTRWLDVELVKSIAPELSEKAHYAIVSAIQKRQFFDSLAAFAALMLGPTFKNIATFDC